MAKTVQDILQDSIREENYLGKGKHAHVFALDIPGNKNGYVLRVSNHSVEYDYHYNEETKQGRFSKHISPSLKAALDASTSLTPPEMVIGHKHLGQTILQFEKGGHTVSIRKRQPGQTIGNIKDAYRNEIEAHVDPTHLEDLVSLRLLKDLNTLSQASIEDTLEGVYRVARSQSSWDPSNHHNLLFDPKHGLGPVDVSCKEKVPATENNMQTNPHHAYCLKEARRGLLKALDVTKRISEPSSPNAEKQEAWEREFATESTKFLETVNKAHNALNARQHEDTLNSTIFVRTDSNDAVALSAPPHALLQSLRDVERKAEISRG